MKLYFIIVGLALCATLFLNYSLHQSLKEWRKQNKKEVEIWKLRGQSIYLSGYSATSAKIVISFWIEVLAIIGGLLYQLL